MVEGRGDPLFVRTSSPLANKDDGLLRHLACQNLQKRVNGGGGKGEGGKEKWRRGLVGGRCDE